MRSPNKDKPRSQRAWEEEHSEEDIKFTLSDVSDSEQDEESEADTEYWRDILEYWNNFGTSQLKQRAREIVDLAPSWCGNCIFLVVTV